MKGMLITHEGLEPVAAMEVKEILNKPSKQVQSGVLFDADLKELAKLVYKSQSAKRILAYLGSFKVKKAEETIKNISKVLDTFKIKDYPEIVKDSYCVECERLGDHEFNSVEIEEEAGKYFKSKTNIKINFKKPYFVIYVLIHNDVGYIGIDIANKDLSKRTYKIYNYGSGLKGTLAYGVLRLAGFEKGNILMDPSCGTGTIPIEAALYESGKSPHFYEKQFQLNNYIEFDFSKLDYKEKAVKNILASDSKQKYVSSAKKNAKVAGINLTTTRMDMEWLDTKVGKNSVDILITKPIIPSKQVPDKTAEKVYKDLFYNASYVLKTTGTLAILTIKPEFVKKVSTGFKVSLENEYIIESGHINYHLLIYKVK